MSGVSVRAEWTCVSACHAIREQLSVSTLATSPHLHLHSPPKPLHLTSLGAAGLTVAVETSGNAVETWKHSSEVRPSAKNRIHYRVCAGRLSVDLAVLLHSPRCHRHSDMSSKSAYSAVHFLLQVISTRCIYLPHPSSATSLVPVSSLPVHRHPTICTCKARAALTSIGRKQITPSQQVPFAPAKRS